jgi:hypothetical protein
MPSGHIDLVTCEAAATHRSRGLAPPLPPRGDRMACLAVAEGQRRCSPGVAEPYDSGSGVARQWDARRRRRSHRANQRRHLLRATSPIRGCRYTLMSYQIFIHALDMALVRTCFTKPTYGQRKADPTCANFDAKFHEGTTWDGVQWPRATRNAHQLKEFIGAYERLKLEMDRLKKH